MTTGKTIALTRRTFVGKVMSLLFNILPRLVMAFLLRIKHFLISWLQSCNIGDDYRRKMPPDQAIIQIITNYPDYDQHLLLSVAAHSRFELLQAH